MRAKSHYIAQHLIQCYRSLHATESVSKAKGKLVRTKYVQAYQQGGQASANMIEL